ncbi:hypothetical protein SARC_03961 [Sphaeroforma arctica JP610]|uniref:Uncharacterized protein n=1 Tax=Sphaeroforma arctica JP610 TaxID=667725 RepID=A0A0L0G408_9EUKA|nr:hypothetical protein SARC_03961 [Sphaeroforma arctica JP610]KNC83785.1 hypothetical protein SARC_03961 [Sphaeroforma arctica JP610]|eukprot:XP_014157687.1 hypothetical protein SARC_03961 [Sphaeroforma arctica JP610]
MAYMTARVTLRRTTRTMCGAWRGWTITRWRRVRRVKTAAMRIILVGRDRILTLAGVNMSETMGDEQYRLESLVAVSVFRLNLSGMNKVLYNVLQMTPEYAESVDDELPRRHQTLKRDNAIVILPKGLLTQPLSLGDFVVPYDVLAKSTLLRTGRRTAKGVKEYCAVPALGIADRYGAFMQHANEAVGVIMWSLHNVLKRVLEFTSSQRFVGDARPKTQKLVVAAVQGKATAKKGKVSVASRKRKPTMPDVETVRERSRHIKRRLIQSSDEAEEESEEESEGESVCDSDDEEIGETDM